MNCPVCNRNNTVKLSICPSCGAMVDDSVREECQGKVSVANSVKLESKENKMPQNKTNQSAEITCAAKSETAPKPATAEINAKKTNPTLVEFHNRNAMLPEWRLQLQNVVRQRQERGATATVETAAAPVQLITSGANALKAEPIIEPQPILHPNPTLNSALERIEKSRRAFLKEEPPPVVEPTTAPIKATKNYPFHIAPKTSDANAKPAEINPPISQYAKPKLATSLRHNKDKFDTNKLPPLPVSAPLATSFESRSIVAEEMKTSVAEISETETKSVETIVTKTEIVETIRTEESETAEEIYDDCAPFAMRFNAGLFDLIIGSFVSLFLLAPFMFSGNWVSLAGVFAFLATCSIVMFLYLTTAIGFYGRTFGMRLFSLEIIDAESEEYPTFHQAAVSSAVYLLSLALGGIGFLSVPFNEDRRAVHDLVSGTVIVKED